MLEQQLRLSVKLPRKPSAWASPQRRQYARENDWLLVVFDTTFVSLGSNDGVDHAGRISVQQASKASKKSMSPLIDSTRMADGFTLSNHRTMNA